MPALPSFVTRVPAPGRLVRSAVGATPIGRPELQLELDLTRGVLEGPPATPLEALRARHRPTLRGLVESLEKAARDPHVVGVIVHLGTWQPTLAQSAELRAALSAVRTAGKRTAAWSESYGEVGPGNTGYHLATACEQVWLQPTGDLGLVGLSAQGVFLREALDKLGVQPQLSQRYEYKSAAETFTSREMSAPNREMLGRLVTSATDTLVADVARSRELSEADVRAALQRGPLSAHEALSAGLVDRLGYRDEVYEAARGAVPEAELRYVERYGRPRASVGAAIRQAPVVAVVHASGSIHLGRSGGSSPLASRSVGSDTLGAALRAAGRDEHVKAVVLRIDSPGGSYVASDAIRREILELRRGGTTVVASMGSVAASGGYFIAMPCETVLASPGTITGSIGVLAGKQVLREGLERIGVHRETVSGGRFADMFSTNRPFDEEEWARLEGWLDRVYDDFTTKAATDRGIGVEALREVARGRVWTGADALERGLVDRLGGLSDAVGVACERAGVDRGRADVRTLPRLNVLQQVVPATSSESPAAQAASSGLGLGLGLGSGEQAWARAMARLGLPSHGVLSLASDLRLV